VLRERDEFLSLMAHDLRTPLTSIRGYAQLLRRGASPTSDRSLTAALDVIMQQADRLAELTGLLLDVARINTGRVALRRTAVDLVQIVRQVSATFVGGLETAPRELEGASPLVVHADSGQLRRVCQAMLGFAATRAPSGPPARIHLTSARGQAWLTVDDSGPSIPSEEAGHLYDRLVLPPSQGMAPTLGWIELYVARGLVEAHGGRAAVESPVPGSTLGARQSLWLPLHDDAARTDVSGAADAP
jgi:signal transduction histidine kinase